MPARRGLLVAANPRAWLLPPAPVPSGPAALERLGPGTEDWAAPGRATRRARLAAYDFDSKVTELIADLERLGYANVVGFGNSTKHWDSYNWSQLRHIEGTPGPIYDDVYLDGAHIFQHDALAFFLCGRVLTVGGSIDFDDYFWSVANSKWIADRRHEYMTDVVVDNLVVPNPRYEEVMPHKVFRKIG